MTAEATPENKKSGLRTLKPGEVLFEDGANADSLYIIQKGQLRLYKPKGQGFVELAVLRAGEVIGEMAYFDEDGSGKKRSCAAAAMVTTEIIEISFGAFSKTMASLNPWFKTIINTLATRLRKANTRIRELESNSVNSYGANEYEFLKSNDIIKVLGTLFLIYKSHGEQVEKGLAIHKKTLDLYGREIFGLMEAKLDEVINILVGLSYFEIIPDQNNLPTNFICKNLEILRALFIFYNTEKYLTDDKKLIIDERCHEFLEKLYLKAAGHQGVGQEQGFILVPVQEILAQFKTEKKFIDTSHLEDSKKIGITGDVIIGDNNQLSVELNILKLVKLLPTIRFITAIKKSNKSKAKHK